MSEPRTVFPVGPKDRGKRLDVFLHERIPGLSRARIQRVIRERVTLSWGVEPRPARPVVPGGEVRITPRTLDEEPLDLHVPVLRREAGWLAVDKPAGPPVHPVNNVRENSLIRMLRRQEGDDALRLVHRLDAETSGVLLIAADPQRARALATAFERGEVEKEYVAVVRGVVREPRGVIDAPIGEAAESRVFVRRAAGVSGSQAAVTRYVVERRMREHTLLRLYPDSGRRHQLRVHLEFIGHPVLGDMLYGRPDRDYLDMVRGVRDPRREEGGPTRQLLHCARLRFPDPNGGGEVEVRAPLPDAFDYGGAGAR